MAEQIALLASSGSQQIDQITSSVIEIMETHFPQRIRGYYFAGSCADGALTSLSDIDLSIVFADEQSAAEQHDFDALRLACKRISPRNLDVSCVDEATVLQADLLRFQANWRPVLSAITLKCASRPVYGVDIRHAIPFVAHDVYMRTMMHFPYLVLAGQRQHPAQLAYPLGYPDPDDMFFGYTARRLHAPDGTLTPSTKRLVHASGFIATAFVALQTPEYVANKRTAIITYRQYINDIWAEHLETIHQCCRVQWDYRVPEAAADRDMLRHLCHEELAFENYFLATYKDFLIREQNAEDDNARYVAQERLQRLSA